MQGAELEKFNQAVALANAGRKAEAQAILAQLVTLYPEEPNVLLWYAFTSDDLSQAEIAIERVRLLNPLNPALPQAESWLAQQLTANSPVSPDSLVAARSKNVSDSQNASSQAQNQGQNYNSYQEQAYNSASTSNANWQRPPVVAYRQEQPGFFGRIGLGWQFMKQAFAMARENPGLIKPSLYALGANTLIGLFLGLPVAIMYSSSKTTRDDVLYYFALFLVLILNYLVTYFFSAVTIHLVYQHITTGQSDKKQAWAIANQHTTTILMVAAISAFVATVRTAIRNQRRGIPGMIASLVIGFIESVWTVATFFIVPAIVLENRKLGDAVNRATYIIKSNFLQLSIGYIGVSFVSSLIGFIAILGSLALALLVFLALAKISALIGLVLAGLIVIVSLAVISAFRAYLKISYYTCLFKWAMDTEQQGNYAQAPAPLHAVLAGRAYSY